MTPARAVEEGVSRATFYRLVKSGLYLPTAYRGVFRAAQVAQSREGEAMAAILATGIQAFVSHRSALALWGLGDLRFAGPIHVSSGRRCCRDLDGVVVHQLPYLDRLDTTTLDRVPITTIPISIVCSAAELEIEDLEDVAIEAMRRRRGIQREILDVVDRVPPNTPGLAKVRRIMHGLDPAEVARLMSVLESRGLALVRRAGLPPPRVNRRLCSSDGDLLGVVDFIWDCGLIVEWDGLRFHSTRRQKERDDARQNRLVLSGRVVLRYSWRDLTDPARIADEIRRGLAMTQGQTRLVSHP